MRVWAKDGTMWPWRAWGRSWGMSKSAVWEDCTVLALAKEMVMGGMAGTLLVTGHEMEKKLRDAPVSTIMGDQWVAIAWM